MNIEKLFGSKAKCDILKYLIFRRQGVSMRSLESEIGWTFPAIKKQIDALQDAGIIEISKEQIKWSITLHADVEPILKNIFLFALKKDIVSLLAQHEFIIKSHHLGRIF